MPPPESDLTARLRDRIVSGLHRGRLRGGDRLPSLREVAEEFGADHRAVAAAYRTLESEGLAEVRGRSGVYVAEQERIGGLLLSETGRWLATVMAEAWKRQIMIPELPDLLRQCAGSSALRCAFVESTEDHMVAFCAELKPAFGIECVPVYLTFAPGGGELLDGAAVQAQSAGADIVLTTAFHGALVRALTEGTSTPLVVVSANPDLGLAIERRLRAGHDVTVVCVDPRFGDRIRFVYASDEPERVHVVRAADKLAVARLDPSEPVLLTRAARRLLMDDVHLALLAPHSPTLSFESARELSEALIHLNLGSAAGAPEGSAGLVRA